ncbi:MAG: metallophosphoesterase [Clostridia bacterium]|nr:metallophosphoesterase [Clostridia bacterium]
MKILVFSDTHGRPEFMHTAVRDHLAHGSVDMLIHLGDGWRDFAELRQKYPDIPSYAVRGNCDGMTTACRLPTCQTVTAEGFTFFLTHGHNYNVKDDILMAATNAGREKAQVLLYGHTHMSDDHREETLYGMVRCINPGSAGAGFRPSYAVLEIVQGQLLCGFGKPLE